MQPDPQRQWFIFYAEKEEGPMTEVELKRKWRDREIDETAFVYTEGFEDWVGIDQYKTLLQEAPQAQVIEPAEPVSKVQFAGELNTKKTNTTAVAQPTTSTQTNATVAPAPQAEPVGVQSSDEKIVFEDKPKNHFVPVLKWAFVGLFMIAGAYVYWTQEPSVKKTMSDKPKAETNSEAIAPKPQTAAISWSALDEFRQGKAIVDAPVKIQSVPAGGASRPVLVGALAPNQNAPKVWLAVFPKEDRNLMVIPKVWYIEAQVVDGYFSVGPLSLDGYALPAGTYLYAGLYGDQEFGFQAPLSFEVSGFPALAEAAAKEIADRNTQRVAFAEKEKVQAQERWNRSKVVAQKLKESIAVAARGPKTLSAWKTMSQGWGEEIQGLVNEQKNILKQSLFHVEIQKALGDWINSLSKSLDHVQFAASKGPAVLMATRKMTLKQLSDDLTLKQKNLEEIFTKAQNGGVPAVSLEMIRQELELLRKRDQS